MALSDLQIRKTAPRQTRFEIPDQNGLSLRVTPTGNRTWVYRYMIEGRARRMTLGHYPAMSLAEAREAHAKAMAEVKRGIDPAARALETKAARKAAPSVSELFTEYWDFELGTTPSGKERRRMVEKDVLPSWGDKKAESITRRDAVLLLDDVRMRAPVLANRLQGVLVRMFNFAAERGILEYSPLAGMKKKPEQPRKRVLTDDEIKLLWDALDLAEMKMDVYKVTKLALKMILLTGQRPGEVCGMTWDEITPDGLWMIPGERRKGGEPQRLPLSIMAQDVTDEAQTYSADSHFVFRSSHKAGAPITGHSLSKALLRHWKEIGTSEAFTPHDLRRTVRTRLAEIGVDDVVAERVLGHKLQGIMAVYNQHGYEAEKREALERWARKLREIIGIEESQQSKIITMNLRVAK